jgi:hypothetical protein
MLHYRDIRNINILTLYLTINAAHNLRVAHGLLVGHNVIKAQLIRDFDARGGDAGAKQQK